MREMREKRHSRHIEWDAMRNAMVSEQEGTVIIDCERMEIRNVVNDSNEKYRQLDNSPCPSHLLRRPVQSTHSCYVFLLPPPLISVKSHLCLIDLYDN
jgi:hypothetical protein